MKNVFWNPFALMLVACGIAVAQVSLSPTDSLTTPPVDTTSTVAVPVVDTVAKAMPVQETPAPAKPAVVDQRWVVAVLPFTGDQTVTQEQLGFMSGKFSSELIATQNFMVLDRGKMDYILQEQGFQQSGICNTSECKVQMGQMLGVDYLVAGNLVNFGGEYAMHLELVDVGTGQVHTALDLSRRGELQNVYMGICREGAGRLVAAVRNEPYVMDAALQAEIDAQIAAAKPWLSTKRKIALVFLGSAAISAGVGGYFDYQGRGYAEDYDLYRKEWQQSPDDDLAKAYQASYDDMESAKAARNVAYGVSIGALVVGLGLWFWPEGGR